MLLQSNKKCQHLENRSPIKGQRKQREGNSSRSNGHRFSRNIVHEQVQNERVHEVPNKRNKKKISKYIIVEFKDPTEKEKILKVSREKEKITYNQAIKTKIRFLHNILDVRRQLNNIYRVLKKIALNIKINVQPNSHLNLRA